MKRKRWYLSVYNVTREFGGHEEGGWWYDWWSPAGYWTLRRKPTKAHLEKLKAQIFRVFGWYTRFNRFSAASTGGDCEIVLENVRYGRRSTIRPHYE